MEQKITITASSGLDKEAINRMVNEARDHEVEDRKRREEADNRNQLDSLIYQTEKLVKENRERIPVSDLNAVETELENSKKALESGDSETIKKAIESLTHASHKMAEAMYQQQAGPGPEATQQQPHDAGSTAEGDIIDAEYEEQ